MRWNRLFLIVLVGTLCTAFANLLHGQTEDASRLLVDATPERYAPNHADDVSLQQLPIFPRRTTFTRPMVPSRYMLLYGVANPGEAGTFGVIDFVRGELVQRFDDTFEREVHVMAISPDGRLAAIYSDAGPRDKNLNVPAIEVWDLVAKQRIAEKDQVMWGSAQNKDSVLVFLDDKRLLHGDLSGNPESFSVVEARTCRRLIRFGEKERIPCNELGISAGGRYVATGANNYFKIWDTQTGTKVLDVEIPQTKKNRSYLPSFAGAGFSASGERVICCLTYGNLLEVHQWTIPDMQRSIVAIPLGDIRPSYHAQATALQQIPGTDLWIFYNLAVIHPDVPVPLATLDPKNSVNVHGHQWVINRQRIARRVIAPQQGDTRWFWGLQPVSLPWQQIESQLGRFDLEP